MQPQSKAAELHRAGSGAELLKTAPSDRQLNYSLMDRRFMSYYSSEPN
jgi:hypothetical protein